MQLNLDTLRKFGEAADCLRLPAIEEGGFIVPGPESPITRHPGKEYSQNVATGSRAQEARPAAGARQRPPAEAAAPGRAAHAVEHLLGGVLNLEELYEYHPGSRILDSSSRFAIMSVPVGVFRTLPFRAHLVLEIPLVPPLSLVRYHTPLIKIPDVRAWGVWKPGLLMQSHHINPDRSICACLSDEWRWGRDPLHQYVEMCIDWIGRTLHNDLLGRWPGTQHYSPHMRVKRNQPDEYCGCGSERAWKECCMSADLSLAPYERMMMDVRTAMHYLLEVRRQGRAVKPPVGF